MRDTVSCPRCELESQGRTCPRCGEVLPYKFPVYILPVLFLNALGGIMIGGIITIASLVQTISTGLGFVNLTLLFAGLAMVGIAIGSLQMWTQDRRGPKIAMLSGAVLILVFALVMLVEQTNFLVIIVIVAADLGLISRINLPSDDIETTPRKDTETEFSS